MIQRQAGSHASVKVHEILRNLHIDDGDSNITKDKDGHRISSKDSHYMKSKDSHHLIKSKDSYSHIKPKASHHVKSKDSHQHIKSKDSQSNVKLKRQESSSYFQKSDSLSLFWTQGSQSTFQMLHNDKQNESHLKVRNKESHHRSGVGRQRGTSWSKLRQKESGIHQFHASTKLGWRHDLIASFSLFIVCAGCLALSAHAKNVWSFTCKHEMHQHARFERLNLLLELTVIQRWTKLVWAELMWVWC